MRKNKNGISLIVLVITIIVMIILAATIIISLNNTGIIGAAEQAVCKTNIKQAQNLAVLTWSNIYTKPDEYTMDNIQDKLKAEFEKNGLKYEDYNIEVTKNGINVSSKAGCTDSSGVEGGSGDAGSDVVPTNWDYAYSYNNTTGVWTTIRTNDGTQPTGDVVVRFYKNGGTTEDEGTEFDTYDIIVSGNGTLNYNDIEDEIKFETRKGSPVSISGLVTSVDIREGITGVGYRAFFFSSLIEKIKLPDSLEVLEHGAFYSCEYIKEIELPKNLTALGTGETGMGVFSSANSLTKVTIPGKVATWANAFEYCSNLKEVVISEGVTNIDYRTFYGCNSLTTIVIPKSLKNIETEAFSDVTMTIKYEGTQDEWNTITGLENLPTNTTIEYNYTAN